MFKYQIFITLALSFSLYQQELKSLLEEEISYDDSFIEQSMDIATKKNNIFKTPRKRSHSNLDINQSNKRTKQDDKKYNEWEEASLNW